LLAWWSLIDQGGRRGFAQLASAQLKGLPEQQINAVGQFPWSLSDVNIEEKLLKFVEDLVFFKMVVCLVNEFGDIGTIR
jgi:hypothetical protein